MANHYYVKSGLGTRTTDTAFTAAETGAFGSGNLTAANVYATLGDLEGFPSSGDFIYISDQHASYFNNGAHLYLGESVYTGLGVTIISVDDTDCTAYKPGAHCALSDNFDAIRPQGFMSIYGVKLRTGNDTIWLNGNGACNFYDCEIVTGGSNDKLILTTSDGQLGRFFNCTYTSDQVGNHLEGFDISSGSRQEHYNCSYTVTAGSEPITLMSLGSGGAGSSFFAEGCDFSACTGSLMGALNAGTSDLVLAKLVRCKFDSNLTLPTPGTTLKSEQHVVELYGCTNSVDDAIHQFFYATGCGVAKNNDSVYTSSFGGWFKGTTKSSIKVETSTICSHTRPFRFSLIEQYIDLTNAASDTVTLNLVTDAVLTDTDIGAYLTYSDGTNIETPRVASGVGTVTGAVWVDPLAAGTTLATSALGAADWTGEPASPNFYKIEMDTSAVAGAKCVVKVAIEIYTDITTAGKVLYIDPTLVTS